MLNCVIIDDEFSAIEILKFYVEKTSNLNLLFSSTNPFEGLNFINDNSEHIDLVFLDIQMDNLSGIELKKQIPEHIQTIFATAHDEFAIEAYNLEVTDYLTKPIDYQRFIKAINRVEKLIKPKAKPDHFFIHSDKKNIKISIADVVYVEGFGNFLKIYCKNGQMYMPSITFKSIEKYLTEPNFVRIHKSYIVAFSAVKEANGDFASIVYEENGKEKLVKISIGNTYKKHFWGLLNKV